MVIERVSFPERQIAMEGAFELPPLARLSLKNQIFVTTFVKNHNSIKEMEHLFGVSYPTVKNHLNHLSEQLDSKLSVTAPPSSGGSEVLDQLERGVISVRQTIETLKK